MNDVAFVATQELKFAVFANPSMFFPLVRLRGIHPPDRLVSQKTTLVIEGFPRSGNTYAVAAFLHSQRAAPRQPSVAHHLHAPAQFVRAATLKVPSVLLIRAPEDAVASLMVREPRYSAHQALRYYICYHRPLVEIRDQVVVSNFSTTVNDFNEVITNINRKYRSTFKPYGATPDDYKQVIKLVEETENQFSGEVSEDKVARPSEARSAKKLKALKGIHQPRLEQALITARKLYMLLQEVAI